MTNKRANRAEGAAAEEKIAGGRSPEKQSPGQMQDDDMKHTRGGGDVERDIPEDEGRRQGGGSQTEMDDEEETGGRSRQGPGRSRNM